MWFWLRLRHYDSNLSRWRGRQALAIPFASSSDLEARILLSADSMVIIVMMTVIISTLYRSAATTDFVHIAIRRVCVCVCACQILVIFAYKKQNTVIQATHMETSGGKLDRCHRISISVYCKKQNTTVHSMSYTQYLYIPHTHLRNYADENAVISRIVCQVLFLSYIVKTSCCSIIWQECSAGRHKNPC